MKTDRSASLQEIVDATAPEPVDLPIFSLGQILDMPVDDSDNFVGDRAIACGDLTVIAGPPGVGKTRLIAQLAVDSALKRPWLGVLPIHLSELRFLFLQSENGVRRIKHDFDAMLRGAPSANVSALRDSVQFWVPTKPEYRNLSIDDGQVVAQFECAIRRFNPDFVIADSWVEFYGGDNENDARQTRENVKRLLRIAQCASMNAGLITLHHSRSGRQAAAGAIGWDRGAYARGSKALVGAARSLINVAPGDEHDPDLLVITHGKINNGKNFKPFAVRLNTDTMTYEPEPDFDFEAWQEQLAGKKDNAKHKIDPADIVEVLREHGGNMRRVELMKILKAEFDAGRTASYEAINLALKKKLIKEAKGLISVLSA